MKNKIVSISLAVALILSAGLVGCASEYVPEITEYDLTISSTEGGEVGTPGEGTSTYEEGTEVILLALPHTGYGFVTWTGDVDTIDDVDAASTTITMNGDYSITASFVVVHELDISSAAGGSVTDPGEGIFTYNEGTVVILAASPDTGYRFVNWTGDVGTISDADAAVATIRVDTDCSVTATFEEDEVVVFVDPYLEAAVRQTIGILERPIYTWDMEQLTEFVAEWVPISDLSGLEYATHLRYLNLRGNQISDIMPVTNLTNLTELSITYCPLSDISPLTSLINLTRLYLLWNLVSDIAPLANLTSLTHLTLVLNQISDISPLASLTSLTNLYLANNQISDISPLESLTCLSELALQLNQISDIYPLVQNAGLSTGDVVRLVGNPLNSDSINIYIPELEARGVTVYY